MRNLKDLQFKRTVWADIQLAKLAPGNNMKRLGEVLGSDDSTVQFETMMKVIRIMNEGYERQAHFNDPTHEMDVITMEELENLTEEELLELSNRAFADVANDGKTTVEAEPEKKENLPESR